MVELRLGSAALTEASSDRKAESEGMRCDACWILIGLDQREAFLQIGLCEFCDARLNPYPHRPTQHDPRWPGGLVC